MSIKRPTAEDVAELAASLHMNMTVEEAESYRALMGGMFDAYDVVDELPNPLPPVKYPRTPGAKPMPKDNKYGAWAIKTEVKGAASGKLAGRTVVLKDNVALAGVPMMNGSTTLEGFIPAADATIVTRILDAGGTIVGKAVCEHFCLSGGSHTSHPAPVHNPLKMGYSAGGSVLGQCCAGRGRRGRYVDRRRSGRLDPYPGILLRHLWHEGDARAGAVYGRDADRDRPSTIPAR